VLRTEAQEELDPSIAKYESVKAMCEVSNLLQHKSVASAAGLAEEAIQIALDRLVDDADVLQAHAAVQAAVARVEQFEEIARHVKKERAANEMLRRQKRQEHMKLFTEGRKMEECESFVIANNLEANPQVAAVMETARDAFDDANDLCEEEDQRREDNLLSESMETLPVPLASVQAAVAEAISRIDQAAKTIEREYRVRQDQKELRERLNMEKQLITVSCFVFRMETSKNILILTC
jgi:hypothetical protein